MSLPASETINRVDSYMEMNVELYEGWLKRLCAQPSISATGEGVLECAVLVQHLCEEAGLNVERIETPYHPIMLATVEGRSNYRLGFYDHYDVQPVDPLGEWESPPFTPTLRDGRLFARGVADNKGNFVSRLAAIHAWLQVTGDVPVSVTFILDGDEEVGSPGLIRVADVLQAKIALDGLIWESGSLNASDELVTYEGVKGLLALELKVSEKRADLHSMYATVVPSPVWRLIDILSSMRDSNGEVCIEDFAVDSRPPTTEDMTEMGLYTENEAAALRQLGARSDLADSDLVFRHVFGPTLNVSGLSAGYVGEGEKTVLPATATARIDVRLVPDQSVDDVVKAISRHLTVCGFDDAELRVLNSVPAYRGSSGAALSSAVRSAAEDVYSGLITYPTLPAAGPMHAICAPRGIPASAASGTADFRSAFHAPNESIEIKNFQRAAKGISRVMQHLAES